MQVSAIPAFDDNYIWLLRHTDDSAVVVDPGQAEPVLRVLTEQQLTLAAILLTHHHHDHTGGVAKLREHYPKCRVYGPADSPFTDIDESLVDGDVIHLPSLQQQFQIMATPGHTLDHIVFYARGYLFCGDTLFSGGCGRMFEGDAVGFWSSLQRLRELPGDTRVYCAHEYTQANLAFASKVEPDNVLLQNYRERVNWLRQQQQPSLPSSLLQELAVNPFLRADQASVKTAAETHVGHPLSDAAAVFATIRQWKDHD
ncbi:hydroxyacylglutathione hydrolase [Idiomarina xiamenensis]|uniref:Hydroxyacylglutathione hydrolase n=1 Tax=Idiomarina xiamenensis 10-D-4 TaxID=740709 RepID=K2L2W7_9GAMM|nr:hydroxyacylglutathione hydrolase [Idiomarina xiamenensis]EKE84245.1 hydroxyacylglutathione hydrolase GloB [Idiomarina xiamenensis 10-D-4]